MADPEADLERALAAILVEARANVAAGRDPNLPGLEARILVAGRRARSDGGDSDAVEDAVAVARRQLVPIAAVFRSRTLVKREPVAPPPKVAVPVRRNPVLRTTPTISGDLDVQRTQSQRFEGFRIEWRALPAVSEWEVRLSERADARSEYAELETKTLAADETSIELPLGEKPFRVAIVGRGRGKTQRRALITGLTQENWKTRWQRRQ